MLGGHSWYFFLSLRDRIVALKIYNPIRFIYKGATYIILKPSACPITK